MYTFENTGTVVPFCIFALKVNELELCITFSWMAEVKLTEQYGDCYITSMQQPHQNYSYVLLSPYFLFSTGEDVTNGLVFVSYLSVIITFKSHVSCEPWASPWKDFLSYLLPPCSLHKVKMPSVSFAPRMIFSLPTTWCVHSKEPPPPSLCH